MALALKHLGVNPGNLVAGVGAVVHWQLIDNVTLATPTSPATTHEELVTISGDHTFVSPATGFKKAHIDEEASTYEGEDGAGINVNAFANNFDIFMPGDEKELGGLLSTKPRLVVLVGPGECDDALGRVQIGTKCRPARIKSYKFGLGSYDGQTKKGYHVTIGNVQGKPLFYTGAITEEEDAL